MPTFPRIEYFWCAVIHRRCDDPRCNDRWIGGQWIVELAISPTSRRRRIRSISIDRSIIPTQISELGLNDQMKLKRALTAEFPDTPIQICPYDTGCR